MRRQGHIAFFLLPEERTSVRLLTREQSGILPCTRRTRFAIANDAVSGGILPCTRNVLFAK